LSSTSALISESPVIPKAQLSPLKNKEIEATGTECLNLPTLRRHYNFKKNYQNTLLFEVYSFYCTYLYEHFIFTTLG
jgi:hypothetical protein